MNIIVIVSDTFRFDNLGCTAKVRGRFKTPRGEVRTPHLDRFAERACVFTDARIGSFPTVPHRKDLFTGRLVFPWEGWSALRPDAVTLPGMLAKAGYETMMVQDTPHTLQRGFHFDRDFHGWDLIRGQENDRLASWRAEQPFDPSLLRGEELWRQHLANSAERRRSEADCYVAQTMTRANRWLEGWRGRRRRDPFFLYVDTFDPHEPWDAPAWYEDMYDSGFGEPVNRYPRQGNVKGHFSKREVDHIRAIYAAEVTLVDRWVGFLLETVERMGLMEDTCIVFTSDHGYCLGEHDHEGKNMTPLFEEIARIPLLIHLPGQTRIRRVGGLVQPCDLAPTLLEMAGAETPDTMFGRSLRPLMEGTSRRLRSHAFSSACPGGRPEALRLTVTSGGWTLVYPDSRSDAPYDDGKPRLHDLKRDPRQEKNLISRERGRARRMHAAFEKWLGEVGAPSDFPYFEAP